MNDNEKKLYSAVSEHDRAEFSDIIRRENSPFLLRELSHIRGNILECIRISGSVLEVNAGYGALTDRLSDMVDRIFCICEDDDKRSIIEKRCADKTGIEYRVGRATRILPDLKDSFDTIIIYDYPDGDLEWFLSEAEHLLEADGTILFVCKNRIGMKYWAGCQYEPAGGFFKGIENAADEKMYTRSEIKDIMEAHPGWQADFYYPYPDEVFTMQIYSDEVLPKQGELTANAVIDDRIRMVLFDESRAYDTVIEEGFFPEISNAFAVALSRKNL